jgi:hypothetical protein
VMNKNIDLGNGLKFENIGAGKKHFQKILKDTALGTRVTSQEFSEIKALYEAYCRNTSFPVSSPAVAFLPVHESGVGYTRKCFGIEFKDGSTSRFSIDKALSAIAS